MLIGGVKAGLPVAQDVPHISNQSLFVCSDVSVHIVFTFNRA